MNDRVEAVARGYVDAGSRVILTNTFGSNRIRLSEQQPALAVDVQNDHRVFVLVDASNSSATFEFAFALKQHKLATLVGQPTGGNQRGINGGAFFFLRLPASKLEVDLPLIAQFPMPWGSERPDTGVSPDVLVSPAALDLAQQTDAELEAVKRLIREGQEPRR